MIRLLLYWWVITSNCEIVAAAAGAFVLFQNPNALPMFKRITVKRRNSKWNQMPTKISISRFIHGFGAGTIVIVVSRNCWLTFDGYWFRKTSLYRSLYIHGKCGNHLNQLVAREQAKNTENPPFAIPKINLPSSTMNIFRSVKTFTAFIISTITKAF